MSRTIGLSSLATIIMLVAACDSAETSGSSSPLEVAQLEARKIPELQAMADSACLCSRQKQNGRDEACWREFNQTIATYEHTSWSSACGAESASIVTFDKAEELAVTTAYPYGACSAGEVPIRKSEYKRKNGPSGC